MVAVDWTLYDHSVAVYEFLAKWLFVHELFITSTRLHAYMSTHLAHEVEEVVLSVYYDTLVK